MNINSVNIAQGAAVDLSKLKKPENMQAATKPEEVSSQDSEDYKDLYHYEDGMTLSRLIEKDLVSPLTGEVVKARDDYGNKNWGLGDAIKGEDDKIERNLYQKTVEARDGFRELMTQLEKTNPDLANKDWGFSINENNKIEITDPLNQLTDDDKAFLSEKLDNLNHDGALSEFADALSMKMAFGREYGDGQNSVYNLTRENMSEVTDFRELLAEDTKGTPSQRLDTQLARQGEEFVADVQFTELVGTVVNGKFVLVDEEV